jgi:uncharacterized protein YcgI (DUF1989 family)
MPFEKSFYERLVAQRREWKPRSTAVLHDLSGTLCQVSAGELIRLRLAAGAQIVHFFPFNAYDPDERYDGQNTSLFESLYLTRFSRLFGTMARSRPLMTLLEDSVTPPRYPGACPGRHHPTFGGNGTPADWRFGGGAEGISTAWEQYVALLATLDLPASLIKDEVCFFEKVAIAPYSQQLLRFASDALPGDCVTLFAEIDLTILIALSPYVDGGRAASDLSGAETRPVEVTVFEKISKPLGWPYPGQPYADVLLYLDENGVRADTPTPTPGLE